HVGRKLLVAAMFGDFFDAGMQIADHAFRADALFAVEAQLHAQHAVRRGVLRPHVEDDFVGAENRSFDVHSAGVIAAVSVRHGYWPLSMPRFSRTQASSCCKMS